MVRPRALARRCLLVVASGILLSGCQGEAPAPVKSLEIVKGQVVRYEPDSQILTLTGTVAARVESNLSFRSAGQIAQRLVDVGDHVEAGQVLATLETQEQEADLASAQATLQAAEATLLQTRTDFERQQQLFRGGITTRSTFESAQEAFRSAQGSVDSARADVGTAQDQLSFTVLKAESAGVITERDGEAGQVVDAAQTVFSLAQDGERDAIFDVYEALLAEPPRDDKIDVHLIADPSVRAVATLREVSPTFDTATGTVRVKMSLIDPPAALSLGAAVSGVGRLTPRNVVTLPWSALTANAAGPALWIVDPQTKAVSLRTVSIDRYRTGLILVRDGLKAGETVVTAGGQLLREGQVVAIAPEEAP